MLPTDPNILYSYLNTKLRNDYSSIAALCDDMDEDEIWKIRDRINQLADEI